MQAAKSAQILSFYYALAGEWGPQHWWPAETPFEVIVGAYLTQNTSWNNVELAILNLRAAGALSVCGIRQASLEDIERLIRPAGYFRQKSKRLKTFIAYLDRRYQGSLDRMFQQSTERLRAELLDLNGVGPETADSILLYAGNHPIFVVDAYTRRILDRHDIMPANSDYDQIRALFEAALTGCQPPRPGTVTGIAQIENSAHSPSPVSSSPRGTRAQVYNEMHALMVTAAKHYCLKKEPKCQGCPLAPFLTGRSCG